MHRKEEATDDISAQAASRRESLESLGESSETGGESLSEIERDRETEREREQQWLVMGGNSWLKRSRSSP